MVKQGHYAKVSRQKKLRQLKRRHQVRADRTIDPSELSEFLLVRYHLTHGKSQRPLLRKTMQRFLAQWLACAENTNGTTWSIATITDQALQQFNRQLPWQGYALVGQAFMALQTFLTKEVPAVPLAERLLVTDTISVAQWQRALSTQLAVNVLLGLFGTQLDRVTNAQIAEMRTGLLTEHGQVDWTKAADLLAPVTVLPTDPDPATQTWLTQLAKLTPTDFD